MCLGLLIASNGSFAQNLSAGSTMQHDNHVMDFTGIAANTTSSPQNDEVLAEAPSQIRLHFPEFVRLVKLTLRDANTEWIDIDFRYQPKLEEQFIKPLPQLNESTYYVVDWAILALNDQLVRGQFSFAFGADADSPSVSKEAEMLMMEMQQTMPGLPFRPAEIIINREPETYDAPFTIRLD
ncbi:MAG: hypothetical protein COC19_06365 [SAR86 cluster bacterium]|uniref:CopC domain-containing protein n=1 Tax=SAR86 cluster bacterium TaxID=2030880 RepID=A0A2A4MJQ8_9GAMM|nr:MAG: hypothetical protein COC19_06365 [SAR86 cluster bacterium]